MNHIFTCQKISIFIFSKKNVEMEFNEQENKQNLSLDIFSNAKYINIDWKINIKTKFPMSQHH